VPDDNAERSQKRHVEKKNNNARKKKKTDDTARLRQLVDDALALDDRIKRFRKEEAAQKNKNRDAREAEAKRLAEEAAKKKEDDARIAAEKEVAAKAEREAGKKSKEAAKTAVKKNKRVVRGAVKDANYFAGTGDASASQIDMVLNDVDLLLAKVDAEELAELTSKLSLAKEADKIKTVFSAEISRLVKDGKLNASEAKSLSA